MHTIVAWDGGDSIADNNTSQPIMYQRTDGAFSAPQATARTDYPETRDRGLETYLKHKDRGLDMFHLTLRATNHIDWNGNGVGSLAGNRLSELVINYYSLAWLDRHLKGKLVFDDAGNVLTYEGRTEDEERAYRQAQAQDAFDRLTAMKFDDSADIHNISMGLYDPAKHAASGDPLYGGNVPYSIDGLWVTDRLSPEWRSFCSVSVPDYLGGSDGSPGGSTVARADSGADGDVRLTGCTSSADSNVLDTSMALAIEGRGADRVLAARLSAADGSGVASRTIDFYADGHLLGSSTTGSGGEARLALPPKYRSGKHGFEARFSGDDELRGILGQHERVGLGKGPTGSPRCETHAVHLSDLQPTLMRSSGLCRLQAFDRPEGFRSGALDGSDQRGQSLVVCRDERDRDVAFGATAVNPGHRPTLSVESVYVGEIVALGYDPDLRLPGRESFVEIDPGQRTQGDSDGVANEPLDRR